MLRQSTASGPAVLIFNLSIKTDEAAIQLLLPFYERLLRSYMNSL